MKVLVSLILMFSGSNAFAANRDVSLDKIRCENISQEKGNKNSKSDKAENTGQKEKSTAGEVI